MREETEKIVQEVVIPKEKAVFRLDGNGCWHNDGGRFRHKKIIDYFNASIRRDAGGYHLYQVRDNIHEKVYFPYEDTALFVFDVLFGGEVVTLVLNTGARIPLDPAGLFVCSDHLYLEHECERVKFTDRSLMRLSKLMDSQNERYTLRLGNREHLIVQRAQ